jgi:ribosomal-protein-alanine N-acetyltransferase
MTPGTQVLESARLRLRPFRKADALGCFENYCSDPLTTRYLTWDPHQTPDVTSSFIERKLPLYDSPDYYDWVVTLKDTGEIIGSICLVALTPKQKYAEIGYAYGPKYWNHGYATEALKRVIVYLFTERGFDFVSARYLASNAASGKVMAKAHLLLTGRLKDNLYNPYLNRREDCLVRSLTLAGFRKHYLPKKKTT